MLVFNQQGGTSSGGNVSNTGGLCGGLAPPGLPCITGGSYNVIALEDTGFRVYYNSGMDINTNKTPIYFTISRFIKTQNRIKNPRA